jgi:predicted nucleic acid-binding protein
MRKRKSIWWHSSPNAEATRLKGLIMLRAVVALADLVTTDLYGDCEAEARKRLGNRDPEDWPILASALALGCPIWTEDTDFFGCGVATWTSNRVEIFLGD